MHDKDKKFAQCLISYGGACITLTVTPWMNLDPINLPKFILLVVLAFGTFAFCVQKKVIVSNRLRGLKILSLLYILILLLVCVLAPGWNVQQIFGAYGRNTGFITQSSFLLLFVMAAVLADKPFVALVKRALIMSGTLSLVYGLVQFLDFDPAPWFNPDNPIIGFLGNSNFQSAFLGMCVCLVLPSILTQTSTNYVWLSQIGFAVISIFVIIQSSSVQGIFVVLVGSVLALLIKWYRSGSLNLVMLTIATFVFTSIIFVLGMFNLGPLAKVIFQGTVIARYEYWQAAIRMAINHPFFGVGLDSFGDHYLRFRSESAMLRRDVVTDSAHNLFLEQFSTGGVFLGLLYLGLSVLTLRSCVRLIKKLGTDTPTFGVICAWFGYVSQSMVSIGQIGIATWGWILSGLIIGLDTVAEEFTISQNGRLKSRTKVNTSKLVQFSIGSLLGFSSAILPFYADLKFYSAVKSSSSIDLFNASRVPATPSRIQVRIADVLGENGLLESSLEILIRVVRQNPDSYEAWELISRNEYADSSLKNIAVQNLRRLEPNKKFS